MGDGAFERCYAFLRQNFAPLSQAVNAVKKHHRQEEVPLPFLHVEFKLFHYKVVGDKEKEAEDK